MAAGGVARGVVISAGEKLVTCGAIGPVVMAAALQGAGFLPRQAKERVAFVGRLAAWVVLRDLGKFSTPQLGALTGHHHSTVLYALESAPRYAADARYQAAVEAARQTYRETVTPGAA